MWESVHRRRKNRMVDGFASATPALVSAKFRSRKRAPHTASVNVTGNDVIDYCTLRVLSGHYGRAVTAMPGAVLVLVEDVSQLSFP